MNFYLVARRWTRDIIWIWWRGWERQWGEKGLICGVGKNGCSIMSTLRRIPPYWFVIFSHNMRRRSSHSLRTRQTLHQQTYFSSPSWNPYWRDDDLSLSRKLKKIRWYGYALFQKRHSRNASKSGRNAGNDVQRVKGGTSKGTKPSNSKVSEKTNYLNCSDSLRTDLIIQKVVADLMALMSSYSLIQIWNISQEFSYTDWKPS